MAGQPPEPLLEVAGGGRDPGWFGDAVSAMVYSLAAANAPSGLSELQPPYNDLTRFVLAQHQRMPDYLRRAMSIATLGFDLAGCLRAGRRFHHLPPASRARQIVAWKDSSLSFQRDLIRYFESLATLALYSRLDDAAAIPAPTVRLDDFQRQVFASPARELRYEIVVVGSGPGGAITACLLAEAGRNVLLIEEGDYLSLESCAPFTLGEMKQKYRNGGQT